MKATIWTMNDCGWCEMAKAVLDANEVEYEEIEITKENFQSLVEQTNHRTAPQIFIDNTFIGGYNEVCNYFRGLYD